MRRKKNSKSENNKTNSSNEKDFKMNKIFAIIDDSVFSSKTFSLKTSFSKLFLRRLWLLDHATIAHVCNKIMIHRFIKNCYEHGNS